MAAAGCVEAAPRWVADPQEVDQANGRRNECLKQAIITLEDRQSDASTIARAATTMCKQDNVAIVYALVGPTAPDLDYVRVVVTKSSDEAATRYVLAHRASRRR